MNQSIQGGQYSIPLGSIADSLGNVVALAKEGKVVPVGYGREGGEKEVELFRQVILPSY